MHLLKQFCKAMGSAVKDIQGHRFRYQSKARV